MDQITDISNALREQIMLTKAIETLSLKNCSMLEVTGSFSDAAKTMCDSKVGALPTVKDGKLVGVISEHDLLKAAVAHNTLNPETTIEDIHTANPIQISCETTVQDALEIFFIRSFSHLPVVDSNGSPQSILSARDLLFFITSFFPSLERMGTLLEWADIVGHTQNEILLSASEMAQEGTLAQMVFNFPLRRVPFNRAVVADCNTPILDVMKLINRRGVSHVLLTKYGTKVVGIITERDFLTKVFGQQQQISQLTVNDLMTTNLKTMMNKHLVGHSINNLKAGHYRHILLVDEDRYPTGVISMIDVLKFITDKIFGEFIR